MHRHLQIFTKYNKHKYKIGNKYKIQFYAKYKQFHPKFCFLVLYFSWHIVFAVEAQGWEPGGTVFVFLTFSMRYHLFAPTYVPLVCLFF